MSLKNKINTDYIKAFKEKNTLGKSLLGTIKGEIQTIEKNQVVENLSDEEVTKILNKFAKNLRETITLLSNEELEDNKTMAIRFIQAKDELNLVESYLPKNLSAEEIQSKIDGLVASGVKNMGQLMKEFANLPADKKLVSEMVKKILA